MSDGPTITGKQINDVLRLVARMSDDGDVHMSVLVFALVAASKACDVPKDKLYEILELAFEREIEIVPLVLGKLN